MSEILLLQLDGKIPNHALMRMSAHHKSQGDNVYLERRVTPDLVEYGYDKVYASAIFEGSLERLRDVSVYFPDVFIGGSALPKAEFVTLESIGISTHEKDYGLYPTFKDSLGYTQRGCRLSCQFCKVPWMEGKVTAYDSIFAIWRGESYPKHLLLLDNDFFGSPSWESHLAVIRENNFKVCFNQGLNARLLDDHSCEALAAVQYYDDQFKTRRLYTAWDNRGHERILFENLNRLVKYGVRPEHLMVYMLIGYWPGETHEIRDYRRKRLRDFGARPYPMAYERTPELVGYQRWVIGGYDKRVPWDLWQEANYQPRALNLDAVWPN